MSASNCSLVYNATALEACCPAGNLTTYLHGNDTQAYCLMANQSLFSSCLSDFGIYQMFCGPLEGVTSGTLPFAQSASLLPALGFAITIATTIYAALYPVVFPRRKAATLWFP